MYKASMILIILALAIAPVQATPSYFGPSGNIMTPDDLTVSRGNFSLGYHRFLDLEWIGTTTDLDVYHGHYGLTPDIEVGLSVVDVRDGGGSDVAFNGKWRILRETASRPAIAVGVLDVAGNAFDDDPSFYALISKSLTAAASELVDGESRPLRGTLGIGSGFYDGIFAGLDWTLSRRWGAMVEYVRGGDLLGESSLINGGVRFRPGQGFQLDAALVDFDEFAFGAAYTSGF